MRTRVCDLLSIEFPIIQGPLGGPWDVSAELVAAVSRAGALGSIATTLKAPDRVRSTIRRVRELAGPHPFAVNHTRRPFDEEAFQVTLDERPPIVSLALGEPGDLVDRAHDAGCLVLHQVTTVAHALEAAGAGADVIIAQGAEAGGFSGSIGTMALVPQVADAVEPIPVVAAGGIADGRGLAAALALGAQGVNIGTRFLAATEAAIPDSWKQAILDARSEDTVKVDFADHVAPPITEGGWRTVPRALRTPFIERWLGRIDDAEAHADELRTELLGAMQEGRAHTYLPLTGESAGLIRELLPAGEIVQRIVREAGAALQSAASSASR